MKTKSMLSLLAVLTAIFLFTGCADKLNNHQSQEYTFYDSKGLIVEEKSIGAGIVLGILPGGGSFYTRSYGTAIANIITYPLSVLWDPINGANGAKLINYYATKSKVEKLKSQQLIQLERELEDNKIDHKKYIQRKRAIEDFYNPHL